MVFQKSLTRELTFTAIGVFSILLAILVSTQAINLLGRAAEGQIAGEAVGALIGFWALGLFPVLLILTVFVSVMVVLTRLWREHEMVVWLAAGLPLQRFIVPVLRFAVPMSVLVAIVSLYVGPWAEQRSQQYAEILKQREEMSAISPGLFKESGQSNRVYFIEKYGRDGKAQNIFFQDMTEGKVSTVLANNGHVETDDEGKRVLVLEDGRRYAGEPGSAAYEVVEFKRYAVVIGETRKLIGPRDNRQGLSTRTLYRQRHDAEARSELIWRFSMPVSCLVLALLAIPLSYFNPRSGQTYNLLVAILAYFMYQNALTLIRNAALHDRLPSSTMFACHLAVLLIALALMRYRNRPARPLGRVVSSLFGKA
ncbi:LPS export ABC transporter permease LptF [Paludibacterium paludis]|uniref:Lipopolysaccharide export system permease protein LptF n=1 Tax=Paludibacterium paludis TaxID=1225769 RepID=A0A918P4P7_9NEIS|nr:LPS export ABC transporter permease LptF [Paludibacterium paludis]GGY19193.1 LPS export ABC transporter permease LptF [Paludibacterium paludis]